MNKLAILKNSIMDYAWGSKTFIAELTGNPSHSGRPQAEMWMGTHEKAPSTALYNGSSIPLDKLVMEHPSDTLGQSTARRFGNQLPFLFKVISADKSLSIQAHPDKDQADEGFRHENLKNIPLDASNRNYRDTNHKPELICALEPLWVLKGFRKIPEILDLAGQLEVQSWELGTGILKDQQYEGNLRKFFINLMSMDRLKQKDLVDKIVEKLKSVKSDNPAFDWISRLNREYPDDIGILSPLFLNVILLQPGEALYINAGELHAYLKGSGLEIMANSDNVLRGGLTPKHMDLEELVNVLNFKPCRVERILPLRKGAFESIYESPAEEFMLSVINLPDNKSLYESSTSRSAEIIINIKGNAEIYDHANNILLFPKGTSMFIPASIKNYYIKGKATIYKASVPPDPPSRCHLLRCLR
jgi:mannose-6-phosphate isomerase